MIKIFEWCGEHEIELADLQVLAHLHKYREPVAYPDLIRKSKVPDEVQVEEMRDAIGKIQGHRSPEQTESGLLQ